MTILDPVDLLSRLDADDRSAALGAGEPLPTWVAEHRPDLLTEAEVATLDGGKRSAALSQANHLLHLTGGATITRYVREGSEPPCYAIHGPKGVGRLTPAQLSRTWPTTTRSWMPRPCGWRRRSIRVGAGGW